MDHFDENHFFAAERRSGARERAVNFLAPAPHQVKSGSRLGIDSGRTGRPATRKKPDRWSGLSRRRHDWPGYFAAAALLT
jgi:hypothetical protein